MIPRTTRNALLAAHDLHHASATIQDAAEAGPDVIDEALYAELRRIADRLETLSASITKEAGL